MCEMFPCIWFSAKPEQEWGLFAGTGEILQHEILAILGMPMEELPFRYLKSPYLNAGLRLTLLPRVSNAHPGLLSYPRRKFIIECWYE